MKMVEILVAGMLAARRLLLDSPMNSDKPEALSPHPPGNPSRPRRGAGVAGRGAGRWAGKAREGAFCISRGAGRGSFRSGHSATGLVTSWVGSGSRGTAGRGPCLGPGQGCGEEGESGQQEGPRAWLRLCGGEPSQGGGLLLAKGPWPGPLLLDKLVRRPPLRESNTLFPFPAWRLR